MNIYKLAYASKTSLINALKSRNILIENEEGQDVYAQGTHAVVHLGNIVLTPAVIDADGNETTPAVLSDKWHADIMTEQAYTFGSNEVIIPEGEVHAHSFA